MGTLAVFIVATPAEALAFQGGDGIVAALTLRHERFTELEMGTLFDALKGTELYSTDLEAFEIVRSSDDGSELITRLPDAMVRKLVDLPDDEVTDLGDLWCQSEELKTEKHAKMYRFIRELIRLAQAADEQDKSVYLWNGPAR